MKLYLAYGANTNFDNMRVRCPEAKYVGNVTIKDHRLVFRGVADLASLRGSKVVCAMWVISPKDELALDTFEGFPNLYVKRYITVRLQGKRHRVMFYVMRARKYESEPSERYEATLRKGYDDCGMDASQIDKAIKQAKAWAEKHGATRNVGHGSWGTKPAPVAKPEVDDEDDEATQQFLYDWYSQQATEEK